MFIICYKLPNIFAKKIEYFYISIIKSFKGK
jgi:hypothetical protein